MIETADDIALSLDLEISGQNPSESRIEHHELTQTQLSGVTSDSSPTVHAKSVWPVKVEIEMTIPRLAHTGSGWPLEAPESPDKTVELSS